ncbi:hypothetical protein HAX54_033893 [Datura stramonium]|uniref:Sulfotransferase n=1 Tax=Datura stramonium TaxID=4076 RepID=A0ABS8VEF7_DATST|nr:hypothetical protein [Datura stramonium]
MDKHEQSSLPLPKEKLWGDVYLNEINGFWYFPEYVPNIVRVVNEFKPLSNDVILASFPKTGTTWLKSLLFSILYRRSNYSKEKSLVNYNPHDFVPFLEFQVFGGTSTSKSSASSSWILNSSSNIPRLFGAHIPYQLLGKTTLDVPRVVYIKRNPKDMLVSMWHFVNKMKIAEDQSVWRLEEAVESFCSGIFSFGPYYDHVMGFKGASLEKPQNFFFITYEELMEDTQTHLKRLAEFLGVPFEFHDNDEKLVQQIVKSCSFDILSSLKLTNLGILLLGYLFLTLLSSEKMEKGRPRKDDRKNQTRNIKILEDLGRDLAIASSQSPKQVMTMSKGTSKTLTNSLPIEDLTAKGVVKTPSNILINAPIASTTASPTAMAKTLYVKVQLVW